MAEENKNVQAEPMFQSWDGKPIYAKKAELDKNGNSLELTIVDDVVTAIGGKSVGGGGGGSDIPAEGEVGQVLTKTQDGYDWEDAPVPDPELPDGGTPGQVLTMTQDGVAWSDPESASLPVATESDSVLYTAEPNGEAAWVQMEKTVYGSIMTDEEGTPILDEEGKTIQDEDTATLWTGFNGKGFGAERAAADENGNNIVATYATKAEVAEVVAKIGSIADGGTLTDGSTINVANNAVSRLTTAQNALTLNVNLGLGEIANFAVEITTSVNATLTVTSTIGNTVTTLHPSVAGGTSLESNKIYQVTCVGSCWTVAEFEVISA